MANVFLGTTNKWLISAVYIVYLLLVAFIIGHHELWGDELHSWNIAKASEGFTDLIHNIRYEGHPPLWYTIIWGYSKLSHNPAGIQCIQFFIAGAAIFLLLFYSNFPIAARLMLPFGYYFLFEYGVLSRNYAPALLLCFLILIVLKRERKYSQLTYYVLLFLLANTHLLAAVLAASIHLYFLLLKNEKPMKKSGLVLHLIAGAIAILPALYLIFPPSDSEMNVGFWVRIWSKEHLINIATAPMKSFMPIPTWWEYNFWNTHFLLYAQYKWGFLKPVVYMLSIFFTGLAFFILKGERKCWLLFLCNLLLTFAVALIFPLSSSRYVGFLYIGFVVTAWLYQDKKGLTRPGKLGLFALLTFHIIGSIVAVPRDIQHVFSNACKVNELIRSVPIGERLVTDYYCLNAVLAFVDKPFYCIETNEVTSFILWDQKMKNRADSKTPYTTGIKNLFNTESLASFYLLSSNPPELLADLDKQLFTAYTVALVDKKEGAIEKYSNLYLYRITPLPN